MTELKNGNLAEDNFGAFEPDEKSAGRAWGRGGIGNVFEARTLFTPKEAGLEGPRFLTARRPLEKGQPVYFPDLTFVAMKAAAAPPGALTDQDLPELKGAVLNRELAQGEILTQDVIRGSDGVAPLGASLEAGLRAYALRPASGLKVQVGERVDVLMGREGSSDLPLNLVEAAKVLQVSDGPEPSEVTIAVNPRQIQILEKAAQKGKLTLVLRNPNEAPPKPDREGKTLSSLPKKRTKIEIWSEGEE